MGFAPLPVNRSRASWGIFSPSQVVPGRKKVPGPAWEKVSIQQPLPLSPAFERGVFRPKPGQGPGGHNTIRLLKTGFSCRPERSEGSHPTDDTKCLAALRRINSALQEIFGSLPGCSQKRIFQVPGMVSRDTEIPRARLTRHSCCLRRAPRKGKFLF